MCSASTAPPAPDLAQHFDRIITDRHLKAGRALVAAMDVPYGANVLELGCGTGLFSEHLADLVGFEGDVLGLDPSPYHMSIAHQRSRPNLRFQVGSPFALARFPVGCFDAIVANGQMHNWPDHAGPLAELHRVLKPGGKLGLVTHSMDHPHPVAAVQHTVLAREPYAAYPVRPEAVEHGVNAFELDALLAQAGFSTVRIESLPEANVHATVNAAIEYFQAASWGQFLRHLPDKPVDLRAQARADIACGLGRLRTAEGLRHNGVRLLAVATKLSATAS